jgi:hypothetical protein
MMAMALCIRRAVSVQYAHEALNNLTRIAPPGSERGAWTSAIIYALGDGGVFDGRHRVATADGAGLRNCERDRLMIDTCRDEHLKLLTRDEQVVGEAREAGVEVFRPEEYASTVLARETASGVFMRRTAVAAERYVLVGPLAELAAARRGEPRRGLRPNLVPRRDGGTGGALGVAADVPAFHAAPAVWRLRRSGCAVKPARMRRRSSMFT